jgi:Kyakuja-Dileera-Zisupton transposase
MNMDYAICQAAKYRTGSGRNWLHMLLIYDIVCQWIRNFLKRLELCDALEVSQFQDWLVAIGKFHLAVHVKSCFWTHSLNFIEGVGQLAGEMMESCWSPFNPVATMARSMGSAQRKEILNDHMNDANFKKLVGMGKLHLFVPYMHC